MSARAWFSISVLFYLVVLLWAALVLPHGEVPLHFGLDGTPDRFGSRTEALVTLTLLGLVTGGLMEGLTHLLRSGRMPVELLNLPYKPYWSRPENLPRARRMMAEDMDLIAAMTMGLLAAVAVLVVGSATGGRWPLEWFWIVMAAYLVGVTLWVVRMYRSRYRPPEEA